MTILTAWANLRCWLNDCFGDGYTRKELDEAYATIDVLRADNKAKDEEVARLLRVVACADLLLELGDVG